MDRGRSMVWCTAPNAFAGEALTVHRSRDQASQRGGYGAFIEERVRSWLPRKPGEGDLTVGEPSGGGQYSGGFTGSEVRLLVPSNESFRSFVDRGMGSDLETLT